MNKILNMMMIGAMAAAVTFGGDMNQIDQLEKRAKEFEAKALKYEAEADQLAKKEGYNPMRHKWPAMAQGPADQARAKALQAKRAAAETREMIAKEKAKNGKGSSIAQ